MSRAFLGWSPTAAARLIASMACATLIGCALPTDSPGADGGALTLRYASDGQCPLANIGYPELTFRIDPNADEDIVAVAPDGKQFHVWWAEGFVSGTVGEHAVRDASGEVVVTDGDVLEIPGRGQFPTLHGYRVCASADALYVLPG